MSLIRGKVKSSSLSKPAQEILLASWRPGTLKQYDSYLHRWAKFCHDNEINVYQPRVEQVVEFLTQLFQTGLGYSAINTARSALSSIVTLGHVPLGEHPMIKRFLKGIFELRPSLPKYSSVWDVSILLLYLKKLAPLEKLSLKEISLKMTSLLCILTGQRCQTIHKIDISHTQQLPNLIRITIQDALKTTKPGRHIKPLELLAYNNDPDLCIVRLFNEYLLRTSNLREGHTQLLISFQKPYKPVSKDTISRWVKATLKASGIDTEKFTAHSCRSASASATKNAGLSLVEIMKTAGWSNCATFAKFYDKNIIKENYGHKVLEKFT